MIKICLIVNSLMFGGVEKVIENYFYNYDKNTYQITILTQDNSLTEDIEHFKALGFEIKIVTHKRKNLLKNFFEIKKFLKENKFDIIHSHMSYTNFYVLWLAKKYGVNTRINHYHNVFNFTGLKAKAVKICNKLCDKYATFNFFCSNAVKDYFGETVHESMILYNAINLEDFKFNEEERKKIRAELKIENNFVIGHIGRFTPQKNHMFLIDIFYELQKTREDARLMLLGNGPLYDTVLEKVKKLGLEEKVIFTGVHKDPEKYYNAMDCFVLPSLYEGLGIVCIEAQTNGLSCIVSEAIPQEANLSNVLKFVSLERNEKEWAEIIESLDYNLDRSFGYNRIKDTEFDISFERHKLFDFYQKAFNN